jgi:ubiquinone/menaquinone biosynthesis C-methylase UbiE
MSIQKARVSPQPKGSGIIKVNLQCDNRTLRNFYGKKIPEESICREHPGMHNVVAYEKEWGIYPLVLDFLDKRSENYHLKALEKRIYLDIIGPYLSKIPGFSDIIDAGGGIGRFAIDLARSGHRIQVVDSSRTALKKALKHFQKEGLSDFGLHLGDIADLSMFSDNYFDAVLAIESVCYCDDPKRALKELVRVTKKRGLIIISVEGKYGGMLSEPAVSHGNISEISRNGRLCVKGHLYVTYYTQVSLNKLLDECGIEVIRMCGSHYVADGAMSRLLEVGRLADEDYKEEMLKVEKLCRKDPVLKDLARAWVAVGRKR